MLTAGLLFVAVALCLGGFIWTVLMIQGAEKRDATLTVMALATVAAHVVSLVVVGVFIARVNQPGG